jgi:hypothetical protein
MIELKVVISGPSDNSVIIEEKAYTSFYNFFNVALVSVLDIVLHKNKKYFLLEM